MALGHRFQRRNELWILAVAAWILCWLLTYMWAGPHEQRRSMLLAARATMGNMLLVYDCALKDDKTSDVPEWLGWRSNPEKIIKIVSDLENASLMSDALWVDAALAYHHFAGTTGDAKWKEKAVAALEKVSNKEKGSYYFFQAEAAVRGRKLNDKEEGSLRDMCGLWPADWWLTQLAVAHGMPDAVDQSLLWESGHRAVRHLMVSAVLSGVMLLAGIFLAWPAWRVFRRAAAETSARKGDHARHLRRLWAGAPALLCFSLAGMLHLGVAKVFQISAPLLLLGVSKRDIQMQVVVANGWWLLGAIASLLVWPAAMRWCMAPDCRNVFRVFDIRAASFRDWRWWLFGIAGSGLLYLAFVGLALAMQWVGIDEAMTDYLSRSFKALGSAALPVMILLATLLSPWVEELVHRGFLFTAMRNQFGPWLGATISSTIFALGHLYGNQGTLMVFLCGMVLCYAYQRSNSLVPGMILHACFNLPLFVLKWLQWSA